MFLLLHGNRTPAPNGSVSPQLVARTARAIDRMFAEGKEEIEKICFFAADVYPNDVPAYDYVQRRLRAHGVPRGKIHLDPCATTTLQEVSAFAKLVEPEARVVQVTSLYHIARASFLLRVRGFRPEAYTTRAWDPVDLSFEPMKLGLALAHH